MVPKGWITKALELTGVKVIDGDRGKEYPKASDFSGDGYCLFLSAKNVTKYGFQFNELQFIDAEKDKKLRKGRVKRSNIVLTTRGSVGHFAYYDASVPYDVMRINSGMVILDADESDLEPNFLYALCRSFIVQKQIEAASFGSAQPQLTVGIVKGLKLPIPTLVEQKKIAQILSTWDKAISVTEKLLTNSQQQKKALMQQLLTGKKRLPDENGVSFSGAWKWLRAAELFKTISQKNNSEDEELLAVTQDLGVIPRSMLERRVVMPDGSTKGYKLVVPGNFIISLRSFQGGLEYSRYRGLVSPAYTVLTPIKKIVDEFYKQYYKSYDFIGHLAVAVIGIRDGKQISYEDFSFLKLPYPEIEEQQKIAAVLSAADAEISTLEKKLACLRDEKKALMQQLLTGKRRVKVDEAVAE
ncbi:TPA: restriction endonuclease subunit S [Escherichia coli]|uniref:restriction endonuclease subunit S n=2 Tax=Escherichia coli TaxID=562 RepID=UPI0016AC9EEA|nr:restriction endonuclease subunit S [Escherichia coli]EFE3270218.1 restriction endonuclease subunit S [Escherichia coli]EFE7871568.1 restriction endonuclease subunit S [Escherichia coli]EFJ3142105.1 restriction endonuclease subunit S [Escherichia coli]EFN5544730.1 restriction endonuclease subunit S [Escherichia coli]EFN9289889.1 restriction endonuclease subunit S [Escherichia coli]